LLAASLSAGVSFGAAIDAYASNAGGRGDHVELGSGGVKHLHAGNAVPAVFLDASKIGSLARDECLLVAAALAATSGTAERAVDGDDFFVRLDLFHSHFIWVDSGAAHAAETIGLLEGFEDLGFSDEEFELSQGLAPEELLEASTPGLFHHQHFATR